MKLGLITDIHEQVEFLQIALDRFRQEQVDQVVVIGDVFEIIDDIHGRWFGVTPHELDLIIYCGMGLHKLVVNLLFLFPWLEIRWLLWREKRAATT